MLLFSDALSFAFTEVTGIAKPIDSMYMGLSLPPYLYLLYREEERKSED